FPIEADHDGLVLVAHGGAFAGSRLDIGTRALLEALPQLDAGFGAQLRRNRALTHSPGQNDTETEGFSGVVQDRTPQTVIDLGCGTGALAATFARRHPSAHVIATD